MRAYSLDLRQKIVQAYDKGVSTQGDIAETFGVSLSFVENMDRYHFAPRWLVLVWGFASPQSSGLP